MRESYIRDMVSAGPVGELTKSPNENPDGPADTLESDSKLAAEQNPVLGTESPANK